MRHVVLIALCLLVLAAPASAQFLVGFHGGWGSFTQEDLNAALKDFNNEAQTTVVDELTGGLEYGAHIGWQLNDVTVIGAAWSRLQGNVSGRSGSTWLEGELPATCWLAFLNWLPGDGEVARLGLGADVGWMVVDGWISSRIAGYPQVDHVYEGGGLFLSLYVVGDLVLGSGLSMVAEGGFRMAQVPDTKQDGESINLDLDYSGLFARMGLRFTP